MKNESKIRVRVHTVQAASFNGNEAKLEAPEGTWDLGAGEVLSVGTWIDLTRDAFKALEGRPTLLVYRFVASYANQGTPTTFTIEGSPDLSPTTSISRSASGSVSFPVK
jgi:hypothetical protein